MQSLLGFLSDHSFQMALEGLGAHQERTPFHLQNLDLPHHHENRVDLVFLTFLEGHAGLSVHPSISAQEYQGILGTLSDLEVHQIREGLVYRGRLYYKELCHLSDPSSRQDPCCLGGLELPVDLFLRMDQEIPCQEAP